MRKKLFIHIRQPLEENRAYIGKKPRVKGNVIEVTKEIKEAMVGIHFTKWQLVGSFLKAKDLDNSIKVKHVDWLRIATHIAAALVGFGTGLLF